MMTTIGPLNSTITDDSLKDLLLEIGADVMRGDAGLWLGPHWQPPSENELSSLLRVSWLAVWSESRASAFVSHLKTAWASDSVLGRRVIHEVTGRLEEKLGSYFSLAEICPFFYLNGREQEWQTLPTREQRRSRDEQIDQIERIRDSLLIVAGYETAEAAINIVLHELPSTSALPRVIVCDLNPEEQRKMAEHLLDVRHGLINRLRMFGGSLSELLRLVDEQRAEAAGREPSIKVGERLVPLGPLLERERPIDEDFAILTTEDIQPGALEEKRQDIVEQLVRGGGYAWPAFAHNLHWQRDLSKLVIEDVRRHLRSLREPSGPTVACFSIPGEPGAGLTTLLHEVAFRSASTGFPTLVYRQGIKGINYDTIRTFLEYLAPPERVETRPAVLIFDESDFGFDMIPGLRELPQKLARDGRHCLIVRGITSHVLHEDSRKQAWRDARSLTGKSTKVEEHWFSTPLPSRLSQEDQDSLCAWATKHWHGADIQRLRTTVSSWGANWTGEGDPPPLLLCLYFLLRDEINNSSDLGRHFITRVHRVIDACARIQAGTASGDGAVVDRAAISPDKLDAALKILQQRFKPTPGSAVADFANIPNIFGATPKHEDIEQIFLMLAALGCLRIAMPRRVLANVTAIPSERLNTAITLLERADVLVTSLTPIHEGARGIHARRAFYTFDETVGLRHPGYGRLALDWLLSKRGKEDHDFFDKIHLLDEFVAQLEDDRITEYPITLLQPVLKRLRPSHDDVIFASEVCTRLLRYQKVRGSPYHEWLFERNKVEVLLSVFDALDEAVVRQSAVILHSRGLTRYKSCSRRLSLGECRKRYAGASHDLTLAFERIQQGLDREQPANVITSHGLLYLGWSEQERERIGEGGEPTRADEYRDMARAYLREGLRLRSDNPYAAYGLAESLISDCKRLERMPDSPESAESFATNLSEALNLLDAQPESSFAVEWEDLRCAAIDLLDSEKATRQIAMLQAKHEELGYALEALRILGGDIPKQPTGDELAVRNIKQALQLLNGANLSQVVPSPLASLLRYALFSSMSDRLWDPAYTERFRLIGKLEQTSYLTQPLWLFDYAMLALQNARYKEASEAFKQLRKGRRFIEVPLERSCWLASAERPTETRIVLLRILNVAPDGKGWARIEDLRGFLDPVTFSEASFRAAGSATHPGAVVRARVKIKSSGPSAEPLSAGRDMASGH